MFIPRIPDLDFIHPRSGIRIPDQGAKKVPDPGSGSTIVKLIRQQTFDENSPAFAQVDL